jgi:lysophospholipase L1-like esterase
VPPKSWVGLPAETTILADGSRQTGSASAAAKETLFFIGCSFTFGWAVADEDTFAARLQKQFPEVQVKNYGVPGYSTYQSLLRLEQLLASGRPPQRVLYGYLEGHEFRNVAHPLWTFGLTKYSSRGMVAVPYCTLDGNDRLVRHPPERYPEWPLKGYLASVTLLEQTWVNLTRLDRTGQAQGVTDRLLIELVDLCRARGIAFDMVLLNASEGAREHYAHLLQAVGAPPIDCSHSLSGDLLNPSEGHPNAKLHAIWADCIATALKTGRRRKPSYFF